MHPDTQVSKILLPIDGSDNSFRAASYAISFAKRTNGEITCIHIIGAAPYLLDRKPILLPETYYAEIKVLAEKWFKKIREMAAENEVGKKITKSEVRVVATSIPDGILDYAEEMGANLIVVGTKGQTGVKRFLLGSVADALVRHARCSVLVVR